MKEEMLDNIKQFIKNPKEYELLYYEKDDIHNEYALSLIEAQKLVNYITQLETNWQELKKWLEEQLPTTKYITTKSIKLIEIYNKMQELENTDVNNK